MAEIIPQNPLAGSRETQVAGQIDQLVRMAAQAQLNVYNQIRRLVYQNPRFKNADGTFDSNAVYAAFAANTQLGLTPDQLGQMAKLAKASINFFQPGVIVDEVPEAVISFGKSE